MRYAVEPADGAVRGTVSAVENLGVNVLVTVDAGGQSLRAVVPEADEPDLGDTAYLLPAPGRALLYRADGDGELISPVTRFAGRLDCPSTEPNPSGTTSPSRWRDGCPGLRISLDYDRSHGPSGRPRPRARRPAGLARLVGRGAQRGRDRRRGSTPGYLDRGLPAGEWQVVLGLHRLPDDGLDWRVEVETTAVAAGGSRSRSPRCRRGRPRRHLPAVDGLQWLAGDCHAHTVHSDGSLSVDELAALAAGAGLDFLWVTDHNTTSHHPPPGRRRSPPRHRAAAGPGGDDRRRPCQRLRRHRRGSTSGDRRLRG